MRFLALTLILIAAVNSTRAQSDDLEIPSEIRPFVEENTRAIALENADLNGDGTKDFILVLEELKSKSEDEEGRRSTLILTRSTNGALNLAKRNDKVIYCRSCGGVFGDPFAGIRVKPKTFTINLYGGSNWRWSNSYQFNYSRIDQTWQLVRVEQSSFHVFEPEKQTTKIYTPPKSFGKIDFADFDPQNFVRKAKK